MNHSVLIVFSYSHCPQELIAQWGEPSKSSSHVAAKPAASLAAAALNGGALDTTCHFSPGILALLAKKAGPSAAASASGEDEVVDCCCYLLKL